MFKILIVEDDKELSLLFQKVLEKSGYQVKSASDGAQALEVLDREYIDLIISDIMMPVMDGYELVSELRSAGYQIPVLMITAKSSFDDMIAYVDENGMITSTPPTEDIKKEEINPDEIIIATPKKEEEEPTILRGRVEFFNESRGFGFIKDLSGVEKYFFHVNNVIGNIAENNIVTFDLERGVKGMNAINISLENKSTSEDLAQSKPV